MSSRQAFPQQAPGFVGSALGRRTLCPDALTQVIPRGEDGRAQPGAVVAVGKSGEAALQPPMLRVQDGKPDAQAQQYQEQDGHHHGSNVGRSGGLDR